MPKLAFVGLNLLLFALAVYKFTVMGVIPVTPYDWIGIISTSAPVEFNRVLFV